MSKRNPEYSIIIATNRDKSYLKPIFVNPSTDAELIVIDSNYNEDTKSFLKERRKEYYQVVYAPVKEKHIKTKRDFSQALNTALLYAEGPYILRCDDSLEFRPDFWDVVAEDIEYFSETYEKWAVIGEKLWQSQNHEKWKSNFSGTGRYFKIDNPMFTFSFGIYPLEVMSILNGYSEIYDALGWGYEDIQFLHRLLMLGYKVRFDRELMAYSYNHPANRSPFDFTDVYYMKIDRFEIANGKFYAYNNFNWNVDKKKFLEKKADYIL